MAIGQYRKQTNQPPDIQKLTLLARVMETRQVDLTQETDDKEHVGHGMFAQSERIPDWFAE